MKIAINNFQKRLPVTAAVQAGIRKVVRASCGGKCRDMQVCVSLVDDASIRELNLQYLGRFCPTDVIAFDLSVSHAGKPARPKALAASMRLADIVISTDTAASNARSYGTDPLYETYLYAAHGMLHLLGYTDETPSRRAQMGRKGEAVLRRLGLGPRSGGSG